MEQEHKDITAPQIYETSIGLVGMSKTEYAMYQEEMEKRVGNLHIYVDADACPVVRIVEKIAEKYTIPVTLLCDTNHVLQSDYSEVIVVGAGADAVDYKLISICHKGDISYLRIMVWLLWHLEKAHMQSISQENGTQMTI